MSKPSLDVASSPEGRTVRLTGSWNLKLLRENFECMRQQLRQLAGNPDYSWDLRGIESIDSIGAFLLWQTWNRCMPSGHVAMRETHRALFEQWTQHPPVPPPTVKHPNTIGALNVAVGSRGRSVLNHGAEALYLLGQLTIDTLYLMRHPGRIPWQEISATIYQAGVQALLITGLVGALIGVVVSYLSALELRPFGAEMYVVKILGVGIIRELGPLLAAILVAGRSGSSMTAQLGVMRLTQELDALTTMGISKTLRLILPKVVALLVAMPLLVLWTDATALAGGMITASLDLGISVPHFLLLLPGTVPISNFWIGIGKGAVFGTLIALTAAHFGLRIEPNTESLGLQTTKSVVASISMVIVVDAVFAVLLKSVGIK